MDIQLNMLLDKSTILSSAEGFLKAYYNEIEQPENFSERWSQVKSDIEETGTYLHTADELVHGARMAWRNSNRCIGRLFWKSLKVFDARHVNNSRDAFECLKHHLQVGLNDGDIRSVITIFRQQMPGEEIGPRILNKQLISFAGHLQKDLSVIGDPSKIYETQWFEKQRVEFSKSAFDILPVAIQWPGEEICFQLPQLPEKMIVPLQHPEFDWFSDLQLFWYALPVISDMLLEIGGIQYTAAPFNGWYMGTEIGSRNLCDAERYNLLPRVAQRMNLDTSSNWSLWRDQALLEINRAVLHSFREAGIKISNHHDAAFQFTQFETTEQAKGRRINADWAWIVPPMSGSATPVFHKEYDNQVVGPNFYYQDSFFTKNQKTQASCPFHSKSLGMK